ncbi:hypothetical protein HH213_15740 [Duganella dendranthematis]|uniref:Uncharacterized protein n=1 Tax=Duganella dendranthematis TaxID=2728021 RepID=A0ABX6MAQ2_9BURK|nr:hypothetical protein [Duganella dendranthematis]QJD91403.1 hypothetical protein HH213_15740 [Duganella dendranthematis]
MVNWELAAWVLVNLGVPALAATLIALILLLTPWSSLWLKMMWRSLADGQLYWVAVAFCASALSEASEYRDLAGPTASMFPWGPVLWLLILVITGGSLVTWVYNESVNSKQDRSNASSAAADSRKFQNKQVVYSIIVTLIAGASFTLIHASTVEARKKQQVPALANAGTCLKLKDGGK